MQNDTMCHKAELSVTKALLLKRGVQASTHDVEQEKSYRTIENRSIMSAVAQLMSNSQGFYTTKITTNKERYMLKSFQKAVFTSLSTVPQVDNLSSL